MGKTTIRTIRLHESDNCVVLTSDVKQGDQLSDSGGIIIAQVDVGIGHKGATANIALGETVIKYGAPIGVATSNVSAGEHVHLHNMKSGYLPTFTISEDKENDHV